MRELLPWASSFAVVPVSGFAVGAVAFGASGALYAGANLEFAGSPLGASVHAEQAAIANAWLRGEYGDPSAGGDGDALRALPPVPERARQRGAASRSSPPVGPPRRSPSCFRGIRTARPGCPAQASWSRADRRLRSGGRSGRRARGSGTRRGRRVLRAVHESLRGRRARLDSDRQRRHRTVCGVRGIQPELAGAPMRASPRSALRPRGIAGRVDRRAAVLVEAGGQTERSARGAPNALPTGDDRQAG